MDRLTCPLLVIGGGNMARAIVRGGLDAGCLDPARVHVVDPDPQKCAGFHQWRVSAGPPGDEGIDWMQRSETSDSPAQVLLAIKPQALADAAPSLRPLVADARRVVISILAGTPSATVRRAMGENAAVVRAMPNTPTQARAGVTAVGTGEGARPGDEADAVTLFSALGGVVRLDESRFNAFTAVAGSGPAYVFLLAEAMTRAAVELGLDHDQAVEAVARTIEGAGTLLRTSDRSASALRESVTSKGGTTAAALEVLEKGGFPRTIGEAVGAASGRGEELARMLDDALTLTQQ